jgi:hypothetical protein
LYQSSKHSPDGTLQPREIKRPWYSDFRVFAKLLGAGNSYLTLESIWNVIAVKILVAADDDPRDLQGFVHAPSGVGGILLENSVVEMYFSRTAFDDDVTAICHVSLSF